MSTAYLDCFSGISGNMALAAVMSAGASPRLLREAVKKVIPDFRLSVKEEERGGLSGLHVKVMYKKKDQPPRNLHAISSLIRKSSLPEEVKEKSIAVFRNLARAEAEVHKVPESRIHFHETGAVDAIVDVVGTASGFHALGIKNAVCSPLPMGRGEVHCEHGVLPLPAPAVLELVKGIPVYGVDVEAELVTPTGAALATTLCSSFGPMPSMTVEKVGIGLGDRELPERPNLMRLLVGRALPPGEQLCQVETLIDDMSPERFDFLMERLHQAGALEVCLIPAQAKKNRPALLLRALVPSSLREAALSELFLHSTTLGARWHDVSRAGLPREIVEVKTQRGKFRVKIAKISGRATRAHVEYEDLKSAARQSGLPMEVLEREVLAALEAGPGGQARPSARRNKKAKK